MRTGKNREFTVDQETLDKVEAKRAQGKGLVGGDIDRIPGARPGLAPFVDFDDVPELVRVPKNDEVANFQANYVAHRPLEVEVGFGGGDFLFHQAQSFPEKHFIGFEIRRQLCASLAKRIRAANLNNLLICYEDVRQSAPQLIPDASLQRCSVYFPDPWWKRRHIKRRLLTPSFLDLVCEKLLPGGYFHIKTDVLPYGEQIELLLANDKRFRRGGTELDPIFAQDFPTEREQFCTQKSLPFVEFRYVYEP